MGLTRKAAEQLTTHITSEIILDRIRLSEKFVPKLELEKVGSSCCGCFWVCGSSSAGGRWYACSSSSCVATDGEQQGTVLMVTAMVHYKQVVCFAAVTASIPTTAAMLQPCCAVSAAPAALKMGDARRYAVIVAVFHPPTHPPTRLPACPPTHPPPSCCWRRTPRCRGSRRSWCRSRTCTWPRCTRTWSGSRTTWTK